MRIVAIKSFRNKETQEIYSPGDVISNFTESRAKEVVARGLALVLNEKTSDAEVVSSTLHLNKDGVISFGDAEALVPGNAGADMETEEVSKNEAQTDEIDMTQQWQKVIASVKSFEDIEKLQRYLASEKASEKPRMSVVVALEARITELSNKV